VIFGVGLHENMNATSGTSAGSYMLRDCMVQHCQGIIYAARLYGAALSTPLVGVFTVVAVVAPLQ
jgi:hypothetical protein